jgi:hypothetical protein
MWGFFGAFGEWDKFTKKREGGIRKSNILIKERK